MRLAFFPLHEGFRSGYWTVAVSAFPEQIDGFLEEAGRGFLEHCGRILVGGGGGGVRQRLHLQPGLLLWLHKYVVVLLR